MSKEQGWDMTWVLSQLASASRSRAEESGGAQAGSSSRGRKAKASTTQQDKGKRRASPALTEEAPTARHDKGKRRASPEPYFGEARNSGSILFNRARGYANTKSSSAGNVPRSKGEESSGSRLEGSSKDVGSVEAQTEGSSQGGRVEASSPQQDKGKRRASTESVEIIGYKRARRSPSLDMSDIREIPPIPAQSSIDEETRQQLQEAMANGYRVTLQLHHTREDLQRERRAREAMREERNAAIRDRDRAFGDRDAALVARVAIEDELAGLRARVENIENRGSDNAAPGASEIEEVQQAIRRVEAAQPRILRRRNWLLNALASSHEDVMRK